MTTENYYPIPPTKTQKAIICLPEEVQAWKDENQKLSTWVEELEAQVTALKKIALEERAAVLTADICDGCDSYGGLCMSGRAAIAGNPTRVDDFEGHKERLDMARRQLMKEHPEIDWDQ
ncbi:MAG: hypothetical protein BWX78_01805 [Firmicutes bacterium ADurb.Bin099]|nr:MAG: hypothetical protein BWX78_01805 [Firmicutes bacterium ADurb.Bin099]